MNPIYVVNGCPDRRESVEFELTEHGGAARSDIHWIEAPRGIEVKTGEYAHLLPCPQWVDPHTKNFLKWGQMACFSAHLESWKRIAEGEDEAAIVVEDDIRVSGNLAEAPKRGDLTFLGGKQIGPEHPLEDGMRRAGYLYWTCGYWITRATASALAAAVVTRNLIPTDEFVPHHGGENPNVDSVRHRQKASLGLDLWRLEKFVVQPSGKWPSATEESPVAFDLDTYVYGTDAARAREAFEAYRELGYLPRLLGEGQPGWDTSKTGGIEKLHWLQEELQEDDPLSVVLTVDGYDTLPLAGPDAVLKRFAEMESGVVISGERACWPRSESRKRKLETFHARSRHPKAPFLYPNAGVVVGFQPVIRGILKGLSGHSHNDDQAYWQDQILSFAGGTNGVPRVRVDTEGYIALNLKRANAARKRGWAYSPETRCYPVILHANGGSNRDEARPLIWQEPKLDKAAFEWMEVADGILGMPFLDADTCRHLCAVAEWLHSLWQPLPGDQVPGDELRLQKLDLALWDWLKATLGERLAPIVEARWRPSKWRDPCDAFLIRYSGEGQPSIRLHEDLSYFSCSIGLRRACAGGELAFPRQNFSDALLPEGWLLLWPAKITHPHQVLPVRRGKRISLVVWTPDSTS